MKFLVRMVPVYLVVAGAAILLSLGISDRATQVAAMIPLDGRICIVLDAGHGEPDGGAVSCTGVEESGINLEITRFRRRLGLFMVIYFELNRLVV